MTSIERIIAYGAILAMLVIGVPWYFEHRGAKECVQADTAAVAKQEAANTAQESKATVELTQEDKTYHAALAAPAIPAPAVECVRVSNHRPVLQTASARPGNDGPTDLPKADSQSFDPWPKLAPIGIEADARVTYLQDYIAKVCLAR